MNRARRAKKEQCANTVARPPKEGFRSFCDSKIEMKSQRATEVAERKRSRSEVDTGRRIGASFELRASSAILKGIAVFGRSDALAARGGAPGARKPGPDRIGAVNGCFASATRRRSLLLSAGGELL